MAAAGRRLSVDPRPALDELRTSWSACRGAPTTRTLRIGGLVLRLEGHGPSLARQLPALSHHPVLDDDARPDLTVRVWDLASTDRRPELPGELFHVDGDHDVGEGVGDGTEIRVRYDWPQRVVQAWDDASRTAWWVIERPDTLAWWEEAAPLRPVLAWWLTSRERYFAHGAALAVDGRAVLLVGPGGSGKSTTALRAQRSGVDFLGDDYCLVGSGSTGMAGDRPFAGYHVGSLYRTVKLRPVDGPAFEAELARNEEGRKIVLSVDADRGGRLLCGAELVGVAAVEIGEGTRTVFDPGRAGQVLKALAPTTFEQLPGVGARSLRAFGSMLRDLPTGVLQLGSDADGVVTAVRDRIAAWSVRR